MSLLKVIEEYDRHTEAYIARVEEENKRLNARITEMIDQGMREASASEKALFEGIISGAIGKPREHKVWVLLNGYEVGSGSIVGAFESNEAAQKALLSRNGNMDVITGPFEIK